MKFKYKTTSIVRLAVKYSLIGFGMLILVNVVSRFFISGCSDGGAFYYAGCEFQGIDVSQFVTELSWATIFSFQVVGGICILYAILFIFDRVSTKISGNAFNQAHNK